MRAPDTGNNMTAVHGRGERGQSLPMAERLPIILVGLITFIALLALAGGNNATALCITIAYALTALLMLSLKWARGAAPASKSTATLAVLFTLVILEAMFSMRQSKLDAPHQIWSFVGEVSTPSVDHSRTIIEIIKLLGLSNIFYTGAALGKSKARLIYTFNIFAILTAIYSLLSFTIYTIAPGTFMGFGATQWADRLSASFLSANAAGTFFGISLILGAGLLIIRLGHAQKENHGRSSIEARLATSVGPVILILVASTTLLLTASRAAILATGIVLPAFIIAEGLARRWSWRTFAISLLPLLFIALPFIFALSGAAFFERMGGFQVDAISRAKVYASNMEAARPFPWMGFGLGSFEEIHRQLINVQDFNYLWNIRAMHNVYLQWRQGAGWLGSLPMFLCVVGVLGLITRATTRRSSITSYLRIIIAMSAIVLLHGSADFALEEFSFAGLWAFWLGCGFGLSTDSRYKLGPEDDIQSPTSAPALLKSVS
jgi:O-antigen ligase